MVIDRSCNIFEPQYFSKQTEDIVIRNNMTIDFSFGHQRILETFVERMPEFENHFAALNRMSTNGLRNAVVHAKRNSLLMTAIMIGGKCNANCDICYTDRTSHTYPLTLSEIKGIIDQSYNLGARVIYIPGEGEPTLDNNFWNILEYVAKKEMRIIIFTNGILFSNESEAQKVWSISCEEIVKRLAQYPVYVYHKLWSSNPDVVSEMMGIDSDKYTYEEISINGKIGHIPRGIDLLMKWLPRERVGVEVVVERRNVREIVEVMIPFIQEKDIKSYIEPIIHSGRCFGKFEYDPLMNQGEIERLQPWIARTNCRRMGYILNILNTGYLSCGMALKPEQVAPFTEIELFNVRDHDGGLGDIYLINHTNTYLVSSRYEIEGCFCDKFNLNLAKTTVCSYRIG
jgi:hypothetical protein